MRKCRCRADSVSSWQHFRHTDHEIASWAVFALHVLCYECIASQLGSQNSSLLLSRGHEVDTIPAGDRQASMTPSLTSKDQLTHYATGWTRSPSRESGIWVLYPHRPGCAMVAECDSTLEPRMTFTHPRQITGQIGSHIRNERR